ncbi:MAG: hypothetical protein HQ592_18160, partial [Planctomycetes bacterium]|nr:hypothetical protein [Planctomycetota bacterium]
AQQDDDAEGGLDTDAGTEVETSSSSTPKHARQYEPEITGEDLVGLEVICKKEIVTPKTIQNRNSKAKRNCDDTWNLVARRNSQNGKVVGYSLAGLLEYRGTKTGSPKVMTEEERLRGREDGGAVVNPIRSGARRCSNCNASGVKLFTSRITLTNHAHKEHVHVTVLCEHCYNDLPGEERQVFDDNRVKGSSASQ